MGGQNSKAKKKEFGRKLFKIYDINNDGEITKDEESVTCEFKSPKNQRIEK